MNPALLDDRFWSKVDASGDCWEWSAYRNPGGYGTYRVGHTMKLAHRVSYAALVGDIPDGKDLDHLCRNRPCVNPDHLEPVPRRTNIARGVSAVASQMRQETCKFDHPYDEINSYVDGRGKRVCRACARRKIREQRASGVRYDRGSHHD